MLLRGQRVAGPGLQQRRPGLGGRRQRERGVETDQNVPFGDLPVLLDADLNDATRDLGTHLDGSHGVKGDGDVDHDPRLGALHPNRIHRDHGRLQSRRSVLGRCALESFRALAFAACRV